MSQTESDFSIELSTLAPNAGARRKRKRVGVGEGSGFGKTCGRGHKGQKSRSGGSIPRGFEGGQMPIHRRLPKVGFRSRKRVLGKNVFELLTLDKLTKLGFSGEVSISDLKKSGVGVDRDSKIKLLATGTLESALTIEVHAASKPAIAAVEKAGGKVILLK